MVESLWSKVYAALELEGSLRTEELQKCLQEVQNMPEFNDSAYFQLQGHIYYSMHPQQLLQAQRCFQKALEIDPSDAYARLYLGHCYYDNRQYEIAEENFLKVDRKQLPEFLQMKVDEMIVCCELRISSLGNKLGEVHAFIKKYAPRNYCDDYPFELVKVLKSLGTNLKDEEMKAKKQTNDS